MLYDVHAHIDLYEDKKSIISYIENAKLYTIAMTNLPKIYKKYQEEYQSLNYIKFSLGFHPELVSQYYSQIDCFLNILPEVKYIGEIGLDFSHKKTSRDKIIQKKIFSEIIKNCKKCVDKKILNIHSRNAAKDVIDIIYDYHGKVIMHWFSGKLLDLIEAIDIGCFFSINNQMINTKQGRILIELIPLNRILLETDAPFSKKTKSKYNIESIEYVLKQLSLIKKVDTKDIMKQLAENFYSLIN